MRRVALRPGESGVAPEGMYAPDDLAPYEREILKRSGERHRQKVRQLRDKQMKLIMQMPTLGLHLKLERIKKRWHKEDLAAKTKLSYTTICRIERGQKVSQATLEKVIETLELDFDALAQTAKQRFN